MSSWFDSLVQHRRNQTPWASVGFLKFIKEMLWNESVPKDPAKETGVIFRVNNRPDVSTRLWYEIEFTDYEGKRRQTSSQDFDLLMWRAAQMEMDAREREERKDYPHKHPLTKRILEIADSGDMEKLHELAKDLRGE